MFKTLKGIRSKLSMIPQFSNYSYFFLNWDSEKSRPTWKHLRNVNFHVVLMVLSSFDPQEKNWSKRDPYYFGDFPEIPGNVRCCKTSRSDLGTHKVRFRMSFHTYTLVSYDQKRSVTSHLRNTHGSFKMYTWVIFSREVRSYCSTCLLMSTRFVPLSTKFGYKIW